MRNSCAHAKNGSATVQEDTKLDSEDLPAYLKLLLDEGNAACGDSRNAFAKPAWFDEEKFQRGQKFAATYSFGIMFAELLSLFILFPLQGGLEPLIYSGKSDSPFKAFKRYLSTTVRVKSWYESDIWDETSEGHKNLRAVRGMHEHIRRRMTNTPREKVAKLSTLEKEDGTEKMWTTLHDEVKEDFLSSCPARRGFQNDSKEVYISQTEMAVTQFGFAGLVILFPQMFGIHNASEEDVEGFAHLWRTLGYLLGIEDRFNFFDGSCKVLTQRCRDIVRFWAVPSFRNVSKDCIHMFRCVTEGIRYYFFPISFEMSLLYLCTVLSIDAPRLEASLTFWQKCSYYYVIILNMYLTRIPGIRALNNYKVNFLIKRALNKSPDELRNLENKEYDYQKSADLLKCR